ncbi:MAG: hypothetical protein WBK08_12855 [Nitrospira sp.]|nr:MAG: hypothetical protein E8D42_11775 [Nitrospira sp.]
MPDDKRGDLAALSLGAAERISHVDIYSGVMPEMAKEVGDILHGQEQVFEISHDHLSALFLLLGPISGRTINTGKSVCEKTIEKIYDEVYPPRELDLGLTSIQCMTVHRSRALFD